MTNTNLYREHILELFRNPENYHTLTEFTHSHREHNPVCGDDLTLYLHVRDGIIIESSFIGHGCAISKAAASMLTTHIKHKSVHDVLRMNRADIQTLLAIDLGPVRIKCALLALIAIHHALTHSREHT